MSDSNISPSKDSGLNEKVKSLLLYFASNDTDADKKKKGIPNLEVKITGGNKTHEFRTNIKGELPMATFSGDTAVCKVTVKLPNGKVEELQEIVLDRSIVSKTIISSLTVKKIVTEEHVGNAPTETEDATKSGKAVGEVTNTRSKNGNPVAVITTLGECYDPANAEAKLKLDDNVIYRDILIAASKRSGFIPQAIATLISIEAASGVWSPTITVPPRILTPEEKASEEELIISEKATDEAEAQKEKNAIAAAKPGKAKERLVREAKIKERARTKKKLDEEALRIKRAQPTVITQAFRMWNPNSMNNPKKYPQTAAGLTQFLASTWVSESLRKGTYLCEQAMSDHECVKDLPNKLTAKQIARNDEIDKINAKTKDTKKHLALIKPKSGTSLQVTDFDKLYDLRFNPKISIMASIDYATYNLEQLTKDYSEISSMNHANKAKLVYLSHHLGLGDARNFIGNKIEEDRAEKLLRAQFISAPDQPDKWFEVNDDNWIWAHRSWLCTLIDDKVKLEFFACAGTKLPEADKLFDMIKTLHGKHPEGFVVTKPGK